MDFVSTRGGSEPVSFEKALKMGAAPDGGLFLPATVPQLDWQELRKSDLPQFSAKFVSAFLGDSDGAEAYGDIAKEAFDFPVPITKPYGSTHDVRALELFHGPTGAFKDFGARFLFACLERIADNEEPLTILTATSGDTGAAVGAAAEDRARLRAVILYPRGRVSQFQQAQLSCWRAPVTSVEVLGDFDDCQRLVKSAFASRSRSKAVKLSSANSINIARILPQAAYLAGAAAQIHFESGTAPGFIIPTGNLGHAFACLYARAMGAPIGPVIAATNDNPTLSHWFETKLYRPQESRPTLATAMDVGAPSNFERLLAMKDDEGLFSVERVSDRDIVKRVKADHASYGHIWCPHSATAAEAYARLGERDRAGRTWVIAATAHPFKFADTLEPLIGERIEPTNALAAIRSRPPQAVLTIGPNEDELWSIIAPPS